MKFLIHFSIPFNNAMGQDQIVMHELQTCPFHIKFGTFEKKIILTCEFICTKNIYFLANLYLYIFIKNKFHKKIPTLNVQIHLLLIPFPPKNTLKKFLPKIK